MVLLTLLRVLPPTLLLLALLVLRCLLLALAHTCPALRKLLRMKF